MKKKEAAVAKLKAKQDTSFNPDRGPLLTIRFVLTVVLLVVGVAWIVYYAAGVTLPGEFSSSGEPLDPSGPGFMRDLEDWNYLIGFGSVFLGLLVGAHPSTPLGRGRGVVATMLSCFLIGLAWICVFYAIADDTSRLPIFDDLGQKNLIVGIAFMAVGFAYATRWE
ncbi:cell division protein CrgA [Nocardioides sp. R-C-SC26]|uniref:cell division protein CrgA n=1 Tax=Nocardioides sp. R-C-SC26 TaxID=2870414 RepID=UPI001E4426D3|nr:cell division protein CrgA [Nocardioides sp. R-C-SC26]